MSAPARGAPEGAARPVRTHRPPAVAWLLAGLWVGCQAGGGAAPELDEVPLPIFARMEPAVADQLQQGQARVDSLRAGGERSAALGSLYGRQGQLYLAYKLEDPALACFSNAARLDTSDYRWPYYLGYLHLRQGQVDESRARYARSLHVNPTYVPTYLHLARAALDADSLGAAEVLLRHARALAPRSAAVRVVQARLAGRRDDVDGEIRLLEEARELAPAATTLLFPLGMAYRARGDTAKARYFLERHGPVPPPAQDPLVDDLDDLASGSYALGHRGNEAYLQRRYVDAERAYRQAVAVAPENAEMRANLAAALTQLGAADEAIVQLREALRLDPQHAVASFNLGTLLARRGDDEAALVHYRRALAGDPGYRDAHFNLANALLRLGQLAAAADHFGEVVRLDPSNGAARYGMALALMRQTRWTLAAEVLEEAHAALPSDARIAAALCRLLAACPEARLRDGNRAATIARQLVAAERSVTSLSALAAALAQSGRFEEAVALQEEALADARAMHPAAKVQDLSRDLERYRSGRTALDPAP